MDTIKGKTPHIIRAEFDGTEYSAEFQDAFNNEERQSSELVWVGTVGKNKVEFGFTLERTPYLEDKKIWSYDLYFSDFDGRDGTGNTVYFEESHESEREFTTPQEAIACAVCDLENMLQNISREHEEYGEPTATVVGDSGISVIIEY